MKIVFLGFASTYTPGMSYQDNCLCMQALADGHAVTYLSNPEKFVNGEIVETAAEDTVLPDGLHLIRLPYVKLGPDIVTKKVRAFRGVYDILENEQPDVLFCHGVGFWSILDAIRYKKAHPQVKFYADAHADLSNSGTNWLSFHVLHRIFYRYLAQKAIPYLDKYFFLGAECRAFSKSAYGVPDSLMEFYPLGGMIPTEEEYARCRAERRAELGVGETELLLLHSGKLEAPKRTEELLRAFAAVRDDRLKLCIIGSIPAERKGVLLPLIEADARVKYLGWKTGGELQEYLCAADLYCQPGSQSATMQNAVCRGCGIMLHDIPQYAEYFDHGNVVWVKTQQDMEAVIRGMADGTIDPNALRRSSWEFAREVLDYRKLAARLYR